MAKSKHDQISEKLAKKFGTEYKSDIGVDIVTPDRVIEVESKPDGLDQGIRQVEHATKARYLAVPRSLKEKAVEKTEGTGIGVMSETGRIIKKASRKGN
ncbi:hypothetical protein KAT60_00060 [Candidatus Woesebacteria bacterium]|nr:hypothetical protein [Candidatus Woesebacteria bacterium]